MTKKYKLKKISSAEEIRLIELDFYLFVKYLLENYNHSAIVYDIVDTLANLFGCNITILRILIQNINLGSSSIIPSKEELGVLLYRNGVTVRDIRKKTNIHPQTLYREIQSYTHGGQFEFVPRLDADTYEQVAQFMEHLRKLMRWYT